MYSLFPNRCWSKGDLREDVLPRPQRPRRSQAWLVSELVALLLLLCAVRISASSNEKTRRLVIHVGPHRTGSSYFQARLAVEGGLSERLVHPKLCGSVAGPQDWAAFAEYLCGKGEGRENHASAKKTCKPGSTAFLKSFQEGDEDLIISAEALNLCGKASFIRLKKMFPEFTPEVLIVKRNTKALMLSRYKHRHASSVSTLTDVALRGETGLGACSYVDAECLRLLSGVFGAQHVHVVSYEGMEVAKKNLFDVACEIFSPDSKCFGTYQGPERVLLSAPYLEYSAGVLYNRFSMLSSCSSKKTGLRAEVGSTGKGGKLLKEFLKRLKDIGVKEMCYPISRIVTTDCYECFCKSMLDGEFPVKPYLFEEGQEAHGNEGDICEYNENAIIQNAPHRKQVIQAIEHILGC